MYHNLVNAILRFFKKTLKLANKEDWVQPCSLKLKTPVYDIDWTFIVQQEGFELQGYVPKEEHGIRNRVRSGVTIASGFDIGQHSSHDLRMLGLEFGVFAQLLPYVELTGNPARQLLESIPLTLTEKEAIHVNECVKKVKARIAANMYDTDSPLTFCTLDRPVQTVIMSVAFQYGSLNRRTPKFWHAATVGDWRQMLFELENFGDAYKRRRLREAKLIREYLKKDKKDGST